MDPHCRLHSLVQDSRAMSAVAGLRGPSRPRAGMVLPGAYLGIAPGLRSEPRAVCRRGDTIAWTLRPAWFPHRLGGRWRADPRGEARDLAGRRARDGGHPGPVGGDAGQRPRSNRSGGSGDLFAVFAQFGRSMTPGIGTVSGLESRYSTTNFPRNRSTSVAIHPNPVLRMPAQGKAKAHELPVIREGSGDGHGGEVGHPLQSARRTRSNLKGPCPCDPRSLARDPTLRLNGASRRKECETNH
jgi:hypothetical protein